MDILRPAAFLLTVLWVTTAAAQDHACTEPQDAGACVRAYLATTHGLDARDLDVQAIGADTATPKAVRALRAGVLPRLPVALIAADGSETTQWFRIALYRDVPVWSRPGRGGEPASTAAPQWRRMDVAGLAGSALAALPGDRLLKHGVRAGDVARLDDLRDDNAISAGEPVRYLLASGRIAIHGTGRALQDGTFGQTLRILPENGHTPINAIAAGKP